MTVVAGTLSADEVLSVARGTALSPAVDPGDIADQIGHHEAAARLLADLPPSPAVVVLGPAQAVRPADRGRRRLVHGRPRRGGRPARAERRRQDQRHQDAARPGPPRRRRGDAARAAGRRPAGSGPGRLPAGAVPVPAVAHRRRGARPARPARRASTCRPTEQRECLAAVGLADRAGDRVGGFSKGMQQRLGLAVALVARPELVVLDEPTSALDPIGRADVRDLCWRSRRAASPCCSTRT